MAPTGVVGMKDLLPRWHFSDNCMFLGLFKWSLIIHNDPSHGLGSLHSGKFRVVALLLEAAGFPKERIPKTKSKCSKSPRWRLQGFLWSSLGSHTVSLSQGQGTESAQIQGQKAAQGCVYWKVWCIVRQSLEISYHSESFYFYFYFLKERVWAQDWGGAEEEGTRENLK